MSAVLTPETPKRKESVGEKRFVLHDVSWETYEQLLKNYENNSAPRFTYDRGVLEIMSPLADHENIIDSFRDFIYAITHFRKIDAKCLGANTFKRKDLKKGTEPDACFYFANARIIKPLKKIDLSIHPAPELIIEVDITSPSIDRFPFYAAIGVPEIWRYKNGEVKFFRLSKKRYVEISESLVLPKVMASDATRFVHDNRVMDRNEWLQNVEAWLRSL